MMQTILIYHSCTNDVFEMTKPTIMDRTRECVGKYEQMWINVLLSFGPIIHLFASVQHMLYHADCIEWPDGWRLRYMWKCEQL